jgi:hypothetical protein
VRAARKSGWKITLLHLVPASARKTVICMFANSQGARGGCVACCSALRRDKPLAAINCRGSEAQSLEKYCVRSSSA